MPLQPMLFQVPERKVFGLISRRGLLALLSGKPRYRHTFGGAPQHEGIIPKGGTKPFHLLYTLDLNDPAVGVQIPGVRYLPLYYGFSYSAGVIAYQMRSDTAIQILDLSSLETPDDFPYANYPGEFPQSPIRLKRLPFDSKKPMYLLALAGVFGFDWVPEKDRDRFYKFFVKEFNRFNCDDEEPPPESLPAMAEHFYSPFMQGPPLFTCSNEECPESDSGSLHVLAIIPNKPVAGISLWGQGGGGVTLTFLICPRCKTVHAYNECG